MRIDLCCVGSRFNMYRNAIALLYHGLVGAGHDVTVSQNQIGNAALTIIVPPMAFRVPGLVEELRRRRQPYVVLGIETFDGFSHGQSADAADDVGAFRAFFESASAVLCLFKQDVERYRAISPQPLWLRYGVHPQLEEVADLPDRPVDVFFFGDVEPYPERRRTLQALRSAGLVTDVLDGSSQAPHELIRNARIARAKINLNLAHADHVSPQRVVYLANNRLCCVSNTVPDADGYLTAAHPVISTDRMVEACKAIVADGSWRRLGNEAYDRVSGWTMVETLSAAIDQALVR
ncbi:hypothetical protein [Thalassobaculum sp.]|uniref:hypothetical protein n=1 Tax=Thalassobaculum sp. TaxID=2022740 RepID=UPI0032EBA8AF